MISNIPAIADLNTGVGLFLFQISKGPLLLSATQERPNQFDKVKNFVC